MRFFVYEVIDTRPGNERRVVYVGKGSGTRAKTHLKASHNLGVRRFVEKSRREGFEPEINIAARFDDEADAFQCEMSLIARYGRRDIKTGTLFNLTDGGEGASGWVPPPSFGERLAAHAKSPEMRELTRKRHADPEFARARNAWLAKSLVDPKAQKSRADNMRQRNADPEFQRRKVEATRIVQTSPEVARARLERMARMNADPEYRAKRGEAVRRSNARRDVAEARNERLKALNADPEFRRKQAASMAPLREAQAAHLRELTRTPEFRHARSEALKARWKDPEFRRRQDERRAAMNAARKAAAN